MEALKNHTGSCKAERYIHIHRIGHLLEIKPTGSCLPSKCSTLRIQDCTSL